MVLGFGFLQCQSEVVQCHPRAWTKMWQGLKPHEDSTQAGIANKDLDEFDIFIISMSYMIITTKHTLYINIIHTNELQDGSIPVSTTTTSSAINHGSVYWNRWINDSHIDIFKRVLWMLSILLNRMLDQHNIDMFTCRLGVLVRVWSGAYPMFAYHRGSLHGFEWSIFIACTFPLLWLPWLISVAKKNMVNTSKPTRKTAHTCNMAYIPDMFAHFGWLIVSLSYT